MLYASNLFRMRDSSFDRRFSIAHNAHMPRFVSFMCVAIASACLLRAQSAERHPLYEPNFATPPVSTGEDNLLTGATVTASGHYGEDRPELAVDGQTHDGKKYWGCENLPVWLQADMGEIRLLSSLHVWTYWQDRRVYKYVIECSADGKKWETAVDQSSNSIAATAEGVLFKFEPLCARYVKITFLDNSAGKKTGGHLVEIKAYGPDATRRLQASAIKDYKRVSRHTVPDATLREETLKLCGWRGERASGQIAVWSRQAQPQLSAVCKGVKNAAGDVIPVHLSMVRYTGSGNKPIADVIGKENSCDLPVGCVRPIWAEVNIPATAKPGVYRGEAVISSENGDEVCLPIILEAEAEILPKPSDWKVHLDLWQHPQAIARHHDVDAWSPEHFTLMKPLMKRLAKAGQKVITCSLIDEAWNAQTYDWFPSMIEWVRGKDGVMRWDYTNFDKWVSFMMNEVGIKEQISCYTMIPWSMKVRYLDEATGKYRFTALKPQDPSFEAVWGPFLTDFRKHVKQKGWLHKTCIALDERPDAMVKAAKKLLDKYAPEFKIVSAVDRPTTMTKDVYDISPALAHADTVTGDLLAQRKKEGKKTTFYVCVNPKKPNTFTTSPLAEAEWLPLFAAANKLDGFLRWAYNSWNRNPLEKTDFGNWPAGDCFLVYPGNLSSLRFEKLRDGLEEFEKVNILRSRAAKSAKAKAAVARMDKELAKIFTVKRSQGDSHEEDVRRAKKIIQETARATR